MSVTKYCYCENNCKYETLDKEEILAAIAQAVETGKIGECDTGFITTIKTINGQPLRFFVGEQSEYEALADNSNLFALITNDTTKEALFAAVNEALESCASVQKTYEDLSAGLLDGSITVKRADIATSATTAVSADRANTALRIIANTDDMQIIDFVPKSDTDYTPLKKNLETGLYLLSWRHEQQAQGNYYHTGIVYFESSMTAACVNNRDTNYLIYINYTGIRSTKDIYRVKIIRLM